MRDYREETRSVSAEERGDELMTHARNSFVNLLDLVLVRNIDIGEKVSDLSLLHDIQFVSQVRDLGGLVRMSSPLNPNIVSRRCVQTRPS